LEALRILVFSEDPLLELGVVEQLRRDERVIVMTYGEQWARVVLLVTDEIDEGAAAAARTMTSHGMKVVVVASKLDEQALMAAVAAGVCGFVRRASASAETLVQAALAADRGEGSLPPDLVAPLLSAIHSGQRNVLEPRGLSLTHLTGREADVLRLLADGFDTAEVSRKLSYSERTIKGVVQDVMRRYNLRNRTHAVAYALRLGLI
jgi:DNA-binding NarL/FixJ family response regulator